MMELNEVRRLIEEKQQQIKAIEKDVIALRRQELELKTGLKEGDIVQNGKGIKGALTFNDSWLYMWHWRKLKKDGSPSESVTAVYENFSRVL